MSNEKGVDMEALAATVRDIAAKIKTDKDPETLDELKRLVKKNVPFTLRGYFSAYLLREMANGNRTAAPRRDREDRRKKSADRPGQAEKPQRDAKPQRPAPQQNAKPAAEKKSAPVQERREPVEHKDGKTLYLNIGKIKHLYAKDLAKLLINELGISREDIYFIKVHDKYSFITMNEENCNKAIEKLNGKEINGRVAQINFSNKKAKDEAEAAPAAEVPVQAEPVKDEAPAVEASAVPETPATEVAEDKDYIKVLETPDSNKQ
jgi:DbpA RNA binding domain.